VLEQEEAARLERRNHALQRLGSQMLHDQPRVDEVELRLWQWIAQDVVLTNLHVGQVQGVEELRVDVRRQHAALRAHQARERLDRRPAARSDLETAPSRL